MAETEFIWTTATHNYVSREANLAGPQSIELRGRSVVHSRVTMHGDLGAWIKLGRYTHLHPGATLTPPPLNYQHDRLDSKQGCDQEKEIDRVTVSVGTHTYIGRNVTSQAAAIGSYCRIGDGAILGPRVIIKDCCIVQNGVEIPADVVIAPFTMVSMDEEGVIQYKELPPSTSFVLQEEAQQFYYEFVASQKK